MREQEREGARPTTAVEQKRQQQQRHMLLSEHGHRVPFVISTSYDDEAFEVGFDQSVDVAAEIEDGASEVCAGFGETAWGSARQRFALCACGRRDAF